MSRNKNTEIDSYRLERFIAAQEAVYGEVLQELRRGDKRGHWMWFIFPQLRGLGISSTSEHYGISGRSEAAAYFDHAVLGARLKECVELLLLVEGRSAEQIFSFPDNLKFRSSMTLFDRVSGYPMFSAALGKYFGGEPDSKTVQLLAALG